MIRLSWLAACALAFALGACGGGDDAPTKAEFGAAADKVCAKAEKAVSGLNRNATTQAEKVKLLDELIDSTQSAVDELKDLDRPEGAAGEAADKFVAELGKDLEGKGIPALEKVRDALKARDAAALQKAGQELGAIDPSNSNQLARAAGAKGCGN